jgi:elongation factor G
VGGRKALRDRALQWLVALSLAPHPIIEITIEPKFEADAERLLGALEKLAAGDPTIRLSTDPESGQTVLGGMDEPHLDAKIGVLRGAAGIEINVGAPQVAYRETLGRRAEIDYTHKRQSGGSGEFARVRLVFEPNERGAGYQFRSEIVSGNVPEEYVPGVEKGLESAKDNGLLAGFPVIDFKASLVDGGYHDLDSSVLAFEIAARAAFRELRNKGEPTLLEPIMKVEVTTPEDSLGDIIGDLNSRRGLIQDTDQRGVEQVVIAMAPLANMFGYVNDLRSMSQGRATFRMDYDHYEEVPLPTPPDDVFPSSIGMRA